MTAEWSGTVRRIFNIVVPFTIYRQKLRHSVVSMCTDVIIRNTTQVSVKNSYLYLKTSLWQGSAVLCCFSGRHFGHYASCAVFSLASRHHIRQFMAVGGGRVLMMWYARNIGAIIALLNNACGHDGAIAVKCRRGAEIRCGGRVVGMAR